MNFWKNVDDELKYLGKTRKELALEVGFPDSYISKGISRNSIPQADLALKIAHALNISLEQLLEIPLEKKSSQSFSLSEMTMFFKKNSALLDNFSSLNLEKKQIIENIIKELITFSNLK